MWCSSLFSKMSAVKLIFKRSSILGKRPTNANLEPGELALNTNTQEPGLYFETTDGNTVKVGPTAVLPYAPTGSPERGELWFNTEDGSLEVGNAERQWRAIASPYLGGTGNVVFWAPEFAYSTDSILNDGQALPFQTLTRAILELSKLIIRDTLAGYSSTNNNNRYTIYFSSSSAAVNNEPGVSVANFTTNLDGNPQSYRNVTTASLIQFNPETTGGVICPRGISLVAMDQRKCEIHPTYVPSYINPSTPDVGTNAPLSSVLLLTGNLLHDNFTIRDKVDSRDISSIRGTNPLQADKGSAIFTSFTPHGLTLGEQVYASFAPTVDTSTGTFVNGAYYATPINTYDFYLGESSTSAYIAFSAIPSLLNHTGIVITLTNSNSSAHRLRGYTFSSLSELSDYYTKVQLAFPAYFGGKVTDGNSIVSSPEYVLVAPTSSPYPDNTASNTTSNASPYLRNITVRSNYGMCGGDFDGSVVSGFRSVIANSCTVVSLQNDPAAYEIYTTLANPATGVTEQKWWPLTLATYLTTPAQARSSTVALTSVQAQLDLLNSTPIPNIRYYYETLQSSPALADGLTRSFGIVNQNNDFRHFGFRVKNAAYMQAQSVYTVGCAVGAWALNGGIMSLTNSTSNFGSIAIKAEGFNGINTIGGAYPNGRGFLFEGVQNPLSMSQPQVEDSRNKEILTLGSRIVLVSQELSEGNTTGIQLLTLSSTFSPCFLLPYSLTPGSAVWVATDACTYRAFLATDGGPTVQPDPGNPARFQLRVRTSDSTVPTDPNLITSLGIPYIRRFIDPRSDSDRTYSFIVRNTNPGAVAPQVGSVLRLNQTSQAIGSATLRPNVQLDPGNLGGWGRVFTVDNVISGSLASSPQFNYVISDNNQDITYYLSVTASDYDRPWLQIPNQATGSYTTFGNRNWYCAENNLWDSVYYETSFTDTVGPEKIAPIEPCSPFVTTSPLERQDLVSLAYQGEYAPDYHTLTPNDATYETLTYFRGATNPYSSYPVQNYYDDDDSSDSMGLCLKNYVPAGAVNTQTVEVPEIIQTEQLASSTQRYRPSIIQFSVLSSIDIPNPKQTVVVLRLGTEFIGYEYVRVVSLLGSQVQAIRLNSLNSFYPNPYTLVAPIVWGIGTRVTPCLTNTIPNAAAYDPDWSLTKYSLFRFFEIMGYSNEVMAGYLGPKFWGDREFLISSLTSNPANGYATVTGQWPLEFNEPSTILANTHTWYNAGYLDYSRGLPRFQTTDLPRKLSADYQATAVWGGRVSVEGVDNKGQVIKLGPEIEALTSQLASQSAATLSATNQELYEEQPYVQFPNQVIVYSVDNISSQFNGSKRDFNLTRSNLVIPPSQLKVESLIVSLGAVVQAPGINYILQSGSIIFNEAPLQNTVCDIRVITSDDDESTLVMVPLTFIEPFDGSRGSFTAVPSADLSTLDNISSQFNGVQLAFELKYKGSVVSYNQLSAEALIVSVNSIIKLPGIDYTVNGSFIIFTAAPLTGATCVIKLITQEANISALYADSGNTLMFLGGVEQIPNSAYTIGDKTPTTVIFTFTGEVPPAGTTLDLRAICSGIYWTTRTLQPVSVYSLDNIAGLFDGAVTKFALTVNGGIPLNPDIVNAENIFVSVGGALQLPDISYTVTRSVITFTEPPLQGTTSNLRIVTNSEFITCPQPGYGQEIQQWGLPLTQEVLGQALNQINDLDPPG